MDHRLSVALPVLPALAHAAVLRREAAYLVEHAGAGWADVIDGLRTLSSLLVMFAVVLVALAVLGRVPPVARVTWWALVASLVPQFGYLAVLGLIRFADATDGSSLGEPSPAIVVASLATLMVLVAASVAAALSLRPAPRRGAVRSRAA